MAHQLSTDFKVDKHPCHYWISFN